jgi:glucokinase
VSATSAFSRAKGCIASSVSCGSAADKRSPSGWSKRCNATPPPAAISQRGLEGSCEDAVQALTIFVSCLGAEAGNLALRMMASGGVYLGGGIAPKILPALRDGTFMSAFVNKGRLGRCWKRFQCR